MPSRDQPQADHILRTWPPPRSPGQPSEESKDILSANLGKNWLVCSILSAFLWRPIRPNPFPALIGFHRDLPGNADPLAQSGGSWDFQVVLDPWGLWRKCTEAQDGLCRNQNCFSLDSLESDGVCTWKVVMEKGTRQISSNTCFILFIEFWIWEGSWWSAHSFFHHIWNSNFWTFYSSLKSSYRRSSVSQSCTFCSSLFGG